VGGGRFFCFWFVLVCLFLFFFLRLVLGCCFFLLNWVFFLVFFCVLFYCWVGFFLVCLFFCSTRPRSRWRSRPLGKVTEKALSVSGDPRSSGQSAAGIRVEVAAAPGAGPDARAGPL